MSFRSFAQSNRKSFEMSRPILTEMAEGMALHGKKMPIPVNLRDFLAVIPGGLTVQTAAFRWIMNEGLYQAARGRQEFAKMLSEQFKRKVRDAEVFSPVAHSKWSREENETYKKLFNSVWSKELEPNKIEIHRGIKKPIVIDIDKVNEFLIENNKNMFSFGGVKGLIEYMEAGSFIDHTASFDPERHKGFDLSKPYYDLEDQTFEFRGYSSPKDQERYKVALRSILHATDEDSIKNWLPGMEYETKKSGAKIAEQLGFGARLYKWIPIKKNMYQKVLDWVKLALRGKEVENPEQLVQNPEFHQNKKGPGIHVLGKGSSAITIHTNDDGTMWMQPFPRTNKMPFTDDEINEILSQMTGETEEGETDQNVKSRGRRKSDRSDCEQNTGYCLNNYYVDPQTGVKKTIAPIINHGASLEGFNEKLINHYFPKSGIPYGKYASIHDPKLGDRIFTSEEISEFENEGYQRSGSKTSIKLSKGGNNLFFIKDQKAGGWRLRTMGDPTPFEDPSPVFSANPDVLKNIGVLNLNFDRPSNYPVPDEISQSLQQDMLTNPEQYGEEPGQKNHLTELISVIKGANFGAKIAARDVRAGGYGIDPIWINKNFDQHELRSIAAQGVINNFGRDDFFFPVKTSTRMQKNMDELGYSSEQTQQVIDRVRYILNQGQRPQSKIQNSTYIPSEIMDVLQKDTFANRISIIANFVAAYIKDTYKSIMSRERQAPTVRNNEGEEIGLDHSKKSIGGEGVILPRRGTARKTRDRFTQKRPHEEDYFDINNNNNNNTDIVNTISVDYVNAKRKNPGKGGESDISDMEEYDQHRLITLYSLNKEAIGQKVKDQIEEILSRMNYNPGSLGVLDGIHDYLIKMSNDTQKRLQDSPGNASTKQLTAVASLIKTIGPKLKNMELYLAHSPIYGPELDKHLGLLTQLVKQITGSTRVLQDMPTNQMSTALDFNQAMEDPTKYKAALQAAFADGNTTTLRHLQDMATKDRWLNWLYTQAAGNAKFVSPRNTDEFEENRRFHGMLSLSAWRSLKETEAVYDGTVPKDGCGFNWWGAPGKPGGVNIKGDIPIKKEKKWKKKNKTKTS